MTPDQTEIIFEEYIEMNRPSEDVIHQDIKSFNSEESGIGKVGLETKQVDGETAARVKAEMAKVLGK
jgi:hypothetical protein